VPKDHPFECQQYNISILCTLVKRHHLPVLPSLQLINAGDSTSYVFGCQQNCKPGGCGMNAILGKDNFVIAHRRASVDKAFSSSEVKGSHACATGNGGRIAAGD
jgi:hypothetical protein